jgi:dynein heavy chain
MGQFFVESIDGSMETICADTTYCTPLVFVLSTGADPLAALLKYAESLGYEDRLKRISLGQGQAQKANDLVNESCKNGNWVMLQNCHLSASYMPELEALVQGFFEGEINPEFRLFLTSAPSPDFPVSVLQVSVKLTTEPPRGIRANMKRTYGNTNDEILESCSRKPEVWCKLSFGLAFFHAILQERRKFGPLGWNVRYEFNDSDLDTSQTMLKNFLMEQEEIPWDAMLYVTGAINYGGRVTDEWDQRCLNTALKVVYNEDALVDGYLFSDSGKYYAPSFGNCQSYKDFIE